MTHPITPPPELVRKWATWRNATDEETFWRRLATEAAQWGADQELEACCEWVGAVDGKYGPRLRLARRPKPPSLKEQALIHFESFAATFETSGGDSDLIRRALEQLHDCE